MKHQHYTATEIHKIFGVKPEILSNEFIAGLVVGEGTFYWTYDSSHKKHVPCFSLKMHIRDFDLLVNIAYSLGINDRVYEYIHNSRHYAFLIVRSFDSLRKVIFCLHKHLTGYKREQFIKWLRRFEDRELNENCHALFNIFHQLIPELRDPE